MKKTDVYINAVKGVAHLAWTNNPEIGLYQEHYLNDSFNFSVKLTNGVIDMSIEIVQDYEARPSSVTSDRIDTVVQTFRKA
jgi:hypothetical protein